MSLRWVIESPQRFNDSTGNLLRSLQRAKSPYVIVKDPCYLFEGAYHVPEDFADISEEADVIVQGSLGLCRAVKQVRPYWRPGCWHNDHGTTHVRGLQYFREHLLNAEAMVFDFASLQLNVEEIFRLYGPRLFIRPLLHDKSFAGTVVDRDGWPAFMSYLQSNGRRVTYTTQLLVARAVPKVDAEWRFFVQADQVITGSLYNRDGVLCVRPETESGAAELAALVAGCVGFRPDPVFVVDVCRIGDAYKIVEFGTFSPAGLYAVDTDALVDAVHKCWRENYV